MLARTLKYKDTKAGERHGVNIPGRLLNKLSMHADETIVRQALRYGAKGYVLKRAVAEELLLAVRAAKLGDTYLGPPIAGSIRNEFLAFPDDSGEANPPERLTPRECQVLHLLAEGATTRAIAQELVIREKPWESTGPSNGI